MHPKLEAEEPDKALWLRLEAKASPRVAPHSAPKLRRLTPVWPSSKVPQLTSSSSASRNLLGYLPQASTLAKAPTASAQLRTLSNLSSTSSRDSRSWPSMSQLWVPMAAASTVKRIPRLPVESVNSHKRPNFRRKFRSCSIRGNPLMRKFQLSAACTTTTLTQSSDF